MKRIAAWGLFWGLAGLFYIAYFGREGTGQAQVLGTALPLLAVAAATEFAIGGVLLPRYLLKGRRWQFALYTVYALVISVWLVLMIIIGEFMTVGFRLDAMNPTTLDRGGLLVGVYIVVALALSLRLIEHGDALRQRLSETRESLQAAQDPEPLEIVVDRETLRIAPKEILYLESAGDYVLVNTRGAQHMTKARLGALAGQLAGVGFIRVHRSFVVRASAVERYTATAVSVGGTEIPVSRTYKESVRSALGDRGD